MVRHVHKWRKCTKQEQAQWWCSWGWLGKSEGCMRQPVLMACSVEGCQEARCKQHLPPKKNRP
jgi:hypothetical protein